MWGGVGVWGRGECRTGDLRPGSLYRIWALAGIEEITAQLPVFYLVRGLGSIQACRPALADVLGYSCDHEWAR